MTIALAWFGSTFPAKKARSPGQPPWPSYPLSVGGPQIDSRRHPAPDAVDGGGGDDLQRRLAVSLAPRFLLMLQIPINQNGKEQGGATMCDPGVIGPALDDYVAGPQSSFAAFENQRCFSSQETDDVD
jgi:hypothetical protein